jgi:hypothetical protein
MLPLLTMIGGSGAAIADESASAATGEFDIKTLTCRDALKMPRVESRDTVLFFHGFLSGKKNEMIFKPDKLAEATDRIVDGCIDSPDTSLLEMFEKHR